MIIKKTAMFGIACILLFGIVWGKHFSPLIQVNDCTDALPWSASLHAMNQAWAGAVPALAADIAILNIFNLYDQIQPASQPQKNILWDQITTQLYRAQAMDPFFLDVYRLTEGILAYESGKAVASIDLLTRSEPWLNSADPLIVASFIAHNTVRNNKLAIILANKALTKPDAQDTTIGFAASLIKKNNGCNMAITFLVSRLKTLPKKFQRGIERRIKRYRASDACANSRMTNSKVHLDEKQPFR